METDASLNSYRRKCPAGFEIGIGKSDQWVIFGEEKEYTETAAGN